MALHYSNVGGETVPKLLATGILPPPFDSFWYENFWTVSFQMPSCWDSHKIILRIFAGSAWKWICIYIHTILYYTKLIVANQTDVYSV